jgi:hypothetical protein
MLLARKQLKDWYYSSWPNRDLAYHFHICISINQAMKQDLLTARDVLIMLRYLAGYQDTAHEETIKRALLVVEALAELQTDEEYARNHLPGATKLEIDTKVAEMNTKGLWDDG